MINSVETFPLVTCCDGRRDLSFSSRATRRGCMRSCSAPLRPETWASRIDGAEDGVILGIFMIIHEPLKCVKGTETRGRELLPWSLMPDSSNLQTPASNLHVYGCLPKNVWSARGENKTLWPDTSSKPLHLPPDRSLLLSKHI